jgi:hypothetical protein
MEKQIIEYLNKISKDASLDIEWKFFGMSINCANYLQFFTSIGDKNICFLSCPSLRDEYVREFSIKVNSDIFISERADNYKGNDTERYIAFLDKHMLILLQKYK